MQQQTLDPNIPDLHVEDKFSYTPVILTAEDDSREAFQFFMNCIGEDGIKDVTSNPLFQALDLHDKAPPAVKVIVMKVHAFCSSNTHLSGKFLWLRKAFHVVLITSAFSCEMSLVNSLQFMIDDSDWGVKLCSVTNDEGHTLLHMAAKKGLPVYVYYNLTLAFDAFNAVSIHFLVLWKNFLNIN